MEVSSLSGMLLRVGAEATIPVVFQLLAFVDCLAKFRQRRFGNVEAGLQWPSVKLLGELYLFGAEGLAVRLRCPLAMRAPISNDGADAHDRGPILHIDGGLDRLGNRRDIIAILNRLRMPMVTLEAAVDVLRERQRRGAVEG